MSNGIVTLGFLRTCIDRRFVGITRTKFEEATGLPSVAYWHEAYAGGTARDPSLVANDAKTGENIYADQYAADHGATCFGWQAHIDNCGGLPGATNAEIENALDAHIRDMIEKYPEAVHYRILASDKEVKITKVHPLP